MLFFVTVIFSLRIVDYKVSIYWRRQSFLSHAFFFFVYFSAIQHSLSLPVLKLYLKTASSFHFPCTSIYQSLFQIFSSFEFIQQCQVLLSSSIVEEQSALYKECLRLLSQPILSLPEISFIIAFKLPVQFLPKEGEYNHLAFLIQCRKMVRKEKGRQK